MISIGIIGKPNVGKSTFFYSSTLNPTEISNRPFTTLKEKRGIAYVSLRCIDEYFNVKCNPRIGYCKFGYRYIPIELIDIPGLVKEAHKGKGLGNKFLDNIKNADGIIHIIDISGSTNENGEPVPLGSYNPLKDFEWVEEEFYIWFFSKIRDNARKIMKKYNDEKIIKEKFSSLIKSFKIGNEIIDYAYNKYKENIIDIIADDKKLYEFLKFIIKLGKPIIYAANKIDLDTSKKFYKKALKKYKDKVIIPVSSYVELGLKLLEKEKKIIYNENEGYIEILEKNPYIENFLKYAKETVLDIYNYTGVQMILNILIFNMLKYIAIYPVAKKDLKDKKGNILPDVFLLKNGSTLKDLGKLIYSNFEVMGGIELKTNRKLKPDYLLEHNDVIHIFFKKQK